MVLSPHLDDAALSLGATIAAFTRRGERTLVLTFCAGAPSPLEELGPIAEELTGGSANLWVRTRREEEVRALDILGADYDFDTALDAVFRDRKRYSTWDSLFTSPDPSDSLYRHALGVVSIVLSIADRARFYAPLGIGRHVDHQIVCATALAAVPRERAFFYEDFPYVLESGAREARLRELGDEFVRVPGARKVSQRKIDAVAAYTSQIEMLFGSHAGMIKALRAHERETLWQRIKTPIKKRRGSSRASAPSST